jgi:flotillin
MGNIHTSGPNEALIISGGCCGGENKKRTVVGGWGWAWWCVSDVQRMSLEVMTLQPVCDKVETIQGVPICVTGVAQVKIMKKHELLSVAAEQFLGKELREVHYTVLQTLEGHLRAILGTLTIEEIFQDREKFATQVREVASPDVGKMGIEILSFTIKDVYDTVDYLASLGKSQTAAVIRDADITVAHSNRDAGIQEAECQKKAMDERFATQAQIENDTRAYKLQCAKFDEEVNTAKAQAQLAYELEVAKVQQKIRTEQIKIDVVVRKKQIEIEEEEMKRKEKELIGTVRLPAEAEAFKVHTIAAGKRTQTIESAKAEAEKVRLIGAAEAKSIEAVGRAEAESMRMKAKAYQQYGDEAVMALVLESLPSIAKQVAKPLEKVKN